MSIPFSEMVGPMEAAVLATAERLGRIRSGDRFHLRRRFRPERREWYRNAVEIDADGRPHDDRFTDRPYLVAHPEREIAEVADTMWHCAACNDGGQTYPFLSRGRRLNVAIAAAHAHNAVRHPRRWLRSQHGQVAPSVALDEARRVTSWGADA